MIIGAIAAGIGAVAAISSASSQNKAAKNAGKAADAATALQAERYEAVDAAVKKLENLTPPNLLQYIQPFQKQVLAGEITPEMAIAQIQEATRLAGIQVPQSILNAQQNALAQLQQIAGTGGMTAIDKAQLMEIQDEQAARSAAEQGAIIQDAQQRGVAGSGLEMAARLLSQQEGANRASRDGTTVAANAQARALQAIKDGASLSSDMRDQSYNEQAAAAKAQDEINRFNTGLTNTTNAANVSARNAAQAANLAERQRISDNNAELSQAEAAARQAAAQQQWLNTYNKTNAIASTTAGLANNSQVGVAAANNAATAANRQSADATAAAIAGVGKAADSVNTWYQNSQKKTT